MADPETVAVPNVVGLKKEDAETMLKSVGLAVGTETTANSATVPAGIVSAANPASGNTCH